MYFNNDTYSNTHMGGTFVRDKLKKNVEGALIK